MRALSKLYRANLTEFLSNRRALFLTIAFPVLFICIFGAVFTNQDKADANVGIAVEDSNDEIAKQITGALDDAVKGDLNHDGKTDSVEEEKNPFSKLTFLRDARGALINQLRAGQLDAVIFIPAGLSKAAANARQHQVAAELVHSHPDEFLRPQVQAPPGSTPPPEANGGNPPSKGVLAPAAQLVLTIDPARQLLRPVLEDLLIHILDGVQAGVSGQPQLLDVKTESVQARELRTIDYLLPGILALSIMQLGLFATAQPLVALRVQGVLKRLSATPLPRATLLCAYIAFRLTIALFQTALTVLIGRYAFKVAMVGSWWQFGGWIFLGTLVFLSIGFFMAAVSKNEESCIAMGNIINLPMILLSGVFFPVNHLSRVFDFIIPLVPLNYLGDALRQTMVEAPPIHTALTNGLVLGAWVLVMTGLAVRFFSWESR